MTVLAGRLRTWRLATAALTLAVFFGLWYFLSWLIHSGDDPLADSKLPYPHQIVDRFIDDFDILKDAAWTSLSQALLGFIVGAAFAVLLSVVMAQAGWVEAALMPYVLAAQLIPMIALVPIAQNVFRNDSVTRLFIAAFITFFSVTIAVVRGLKSAPPPAYELMRSYNAGRMRTLRFLELPSAIPMLFSGLRIAAPLSLVGSVLVDLMGAQQGLGYLMLAALTFGLSHATMLWAAAITTLALGWLMSQGVILAEKVLTPWQPTLRAEAT